MWSSTRRPPCTGAQLPAGAAGQALHQRGAGQHGGAGLIGQGADQAPRGLAGLQGRELAGRVVDGDAVRGAIGQRQIEAPARDVHRQVLPEVDELQRGADGVAFGQGRGCAHAVQVQQQAAHRVGRAPAVVQQRGLVGVGGAGVGHAHVLLEGGEQIEQRRLGQLERPHLGGQRPNTCGQRLAAGGWWLLAVAMACSSAR
jgi:hypothetical protein